jgi:hypothetical protein
VLDFADLEQIYGKLHMAGTISVIILVFVAIIAVAITAKIKKSGAVRQRIEPTLTSSDRHYGRRSHGDGKPVLKLDSEASQRRSRRRYGLSSMALSFITGISVGAASYSLAARDDEGVAHDDLKPARRTVPVQGNALEDADRPDAGPSRSDPLIAERLASYVKKTIGQLPQVIDSATTMVFVETENRSVTGNFQVSKVLSDSEVSKIGQFIKTKAEAKMCELPTTDDVRYLNDNGISFNFNYVDVTGKPIVKFTLRHNLCAR